jgi:prophage antirepressor-like protein
MDIVADIPQENVIVVSNELDNILVKQFQHFNINIYGTFEEPLFKAKDIGDLLEIAQIRKTIQNLDNSCKVWQVGNTVTGPQEQWFLTEDGLYEVLFISRKPIAKQFKTWVRGVIKDVRINSTRQLQETLNQQQLQLTYYKQLTYEQIALTQILYVFSTDVQFVYKIGEHKKTTAKKRKEGLQTACVEDIEVLFQYKTSNSKLLESIVHYILDTYRCNSNREHFRVDLEYVKMIINTVGKVMDTCKSSYQGITNNELSDKIQLHIPPPPEDLTIKTKKDKITTQLEKIQEQLSTLKNGKQKQKKRYTPVEVTHELQDIDLDELFTPPSPLIQEMD